MAGRGIVGAGLLALMLLAACGGRHDQAGGLPDPPASGLARPAASPAPSSPTPNATSSDPQAALRASAEQFVHKWYSSLNQANASASPQLVKPLFLPSCELCRKSVDFIEEDRAKHYRVVGNNVTVLEVKGIAVTGTRAVADVITEAEDGIVIDESNKRVYRAQGWAPTQIRLTLSRTASGWLVEDITPRGRAQ